jgi:hypothetical protein
MELAEPRHQAPSVTALRMVEGSPPALIHNYNQLVERFNAGPGI